MPATSSWIVSTSTAGEVFNFEMASQTKDFGPGHISRLELGDHETFLVPEGLKVHIMLYISRSLKSHHHYQHVAVS
jgi:hypothetical protein